MSKEKQIEELIRDLVNHTCMSQFQAEIAARMLFQLGYRKQIEGEWIWTESGTEDYEQYWLCSCCNNKSYWKSKFCEECGAKMKGGAE